MNRRVLAVAVVVVLLIGGGVWWFVHGKHSEPPLAVGAAQKHTTGASPIVVPEQPLTASILVRVQDPVAVRHVADSSQWLKDAVRSPLGQGFLGAWAGFFGSRGEDLQASFKGTVLDYLLGELTARPVQVIWFGGGDAPGVPALVVDDPSSGARDAIRALAKITEYGTATATHCPGDTPPEPNKDKDGKEVPPPIRYTFSRLLIADQAIFAMVTDKRLVMSPKPLGALAGVCGKFVEAPQGAMSLALNLAAFGREAQQLAALLGIGDSATLSFDVKNDRLEPRGISAVLKNARLKVQALDEQALKTIPEKTPVVLSVALDLPTDLSASSLQAFLKNTAGPTTPRQVTILWSPSAKDNSAKANTEVAVVWSRPQDEKALRSIFSGPNALRHETVCGQHLMASSAKLLGEMVDACNGKLPSLASAAPAVVAGLRDADSVTLLVHLGHFAAGLLRSAYDGASVPEIAAAAQQLEELPALGFAGAAQGTTLAPKGFRS